MCEHDGRRNKCSHMQTHGNTVVCCAVHQKCSFAAQALVTRSITCPFENVSYTVTQCCFCFFVHLISAAWREHWTAGKKSFATAKSTGLTWHAKKGFVPIQNLPNDHFLCWKFEQAALEAEIPAHPQRVDGAFTLCLIELTHCSIAEDTAYGRK